MNILYILYILYIYIYGQYPIRNSVTGMQLGEGKSGAGLACTRALPYPNLRGRTLPALHALMLDKASQFV